MAPERRRKKAPPLRGVPRKSRPGGRFPRAKKAVASGKRRKVRAGRTAKASKIGRATRATRKKSRASKPATKRTKKAAAKKAKLYTRYDPTTGQKVRVTSDTFEYRDWPSRKPSKKKIAREAFKSDPLGTSGSVAQQAGKRAIEKLGEQTATRIARTARTTAIPAAVAGARALAPFAGIAGLTALAIGAVLLQNKSVSDARLALGEKVNKLSLAFVAAQKQMAAEYRVAHFADVPTEARNRLLNGYKDALTKLQRATVVTQGGRFGQVAYHTTGR